MIVTWKPIIRFWQFLVRIFPTQLAIKWPLTFPPHPTFVPALPGESITSKISLFYPMRYDCLINITCKNTNWSHVWQFGWHFIQLSIFQLPVLKLLEVLAHYANTGKETFSPFIDSSMDKFCSKPIQTDQSLFDFKNILELHLIDTLLHDSQTL